MIALASGGAAVSLDAFGGWWVLAPIFASLFALSFFFSGTETAFFSLQEIDRRRISEGRTATHRRIHALIQHRRALITTILMGNETVNVSIAATTAGIIAVLFPAHPWLTIVVVTPALVLLSEITPKVIAFRYNRAWVNLAVWPLSLMGWVLALPRWVISSLVGLLARAFGVTDAAQERPIGEEEFLVLVGQGMEQGVLAEDEREIIEAVFDLDDLPVSRLMTPKPDVFSLPIDIGWEGLLDACREARYSRVPIYEDSADNIVGVLLVKDLLRHRRRPLADADALRRLLMTPVFVPATKAANDMMKEMIRRRIHMAFVTDEHGTIMGLVSLDDLIIELVGELGDDTDETSSHDVEQDGEHDLVVRAGIDLEDFEDETGIPVPEGEYHTLGGFVFHTLGRIPRPGDRISASGHGFEVLEMDGRRVTLVRVSPELGEATP